MQKNLNATQTLDLLIDLLWVNLTELNTASQSCRDPFILGAKTAYVECFEALQRWKQSYKRGVPAEIERLFPIG